MTRKKSGTHARKHGVAHDAADGEHDGACPGKQPRGKRKPAPLRSGRRQNAGEQRRRKDDEHLPGKPGHARKFPENAVEERRKRQNARADPDGNGKIDGKQSRLHTSSLQCSPLNYLLKLSLSETISERQSFP